MDNAWFARIESTIFTYVQYMLQERLNAPYPDLKCTTKSQSTKPSYFPTLYLHNLTPIERGQDLENKEINAVLATIEIQVYSNQSETEANKIMTDAISYMKADHWNVTMFPDPQTSDKISMAIARFRKMVTKNEIERNE